MANVIQIKRNTADAAPTVLAAGELGHAEHVNKKKLYIGTTSDGIEAIGGLHYTDILDTVTQNTVLGRTTAGTGEVEELSASALNTMLGTVTGITAGVGISSTGGATPTLDLDFSELTDMTADVAAGTEFILQDAGTESRKAASEIKLSVFNNDLSLSSGTVTSVTAGAGMTQTGTSTVNPTLNIIAATNGGLIVGADDIGLDYVGADNFMNVATSATVVAADTIIFHDATDSTVKKGLVSSLPFTNNAGTVTSVTGGVGIASTGGATPSLSLTVDELSEKSGALVGTDRIVGTSGTTNFAETISQIPLSIFSNDSGWTNNTGTVTSVGGTGSVSGLTLTGSVTTSGNLTLGGAITGFIPDTYLDTDTTLSANSDVKIATQKAVKAYVDTAVTSSITYKGGYNATTNTPDLETPTAGTVFVGDMYTVTVAGEFTTGIQLEIGDVLIAEIDDPAGIADWTIVSRELDNATTSGYGIVRLATSTEVATNDITDANDVITIGTLASNWIGSTNITTLGTVTTCTIDCGTYT